MLLNVSGEVWEWRGPAPYHFVSLSPEQADDVREVASAASYGWGMIPVVGKVGATRFTTSLWPKNGTYVIPMKDAVRRAEHIELGDRVTVELEVDFERRRR